MKILIAGTIQGDNGYEEEYLAKRIEHYLKSQNHTVDCFMLPYTRDMLSLPDQIIAYQMLDLSNIELLITIGYPACMLSHNNKIIYLFETAPMLHEYWESEYGVLANQQYSKLLTSINYVEEKAFKEAVKIVCNSQILCDDLRKKYMIDAQVQYYPITFDDLNVQKNETEQYYVSESSLMPYHRIELLLDTIKELSDAKLYLYIPRSNTVYLETIVKQIQERKLTKAVELRRGVIPNEVLIYAKAYLATDFKVRKIPGGIIRSAEVGTKIISCEDSGAIAEYINVHQCGILEKADAISLSKRISSIPMKSKSHNVSKSDRMDAFMRGLITL